MLKKCSKILIAILFVLIISLITINPVEAKEMTLAELTEAVKEYNPKATYVYVIGDYAFTSGRLLTTQDVMLAARSIEVKDTNGETDKDAIYGEMTIAYFKGIFDSNWKLTGLEYSENIVGTTDPKTTYDIKFIDYNRFISTIDLRTIAEEIYNKYTNKFATSVATEKVNDDITNIKATVKDLSLLPKDDIKALINEFLATEGVESITLTITAVDGSTNSKELTSANVDEILNSNAIAAGKITAKVNLGNAYKAKDVDTFTTEFNTEVDVKAIVDAGYNKYIDNKDKLSSYVSVEREDVVNFHTMLKTVIVDIDSVPVDRIKELAKEYSDKFFNVPGIESVSLTLTALDGSTFEKEVTSYSVEKINNMTNDELKTSLKEYVKTSGITVDSVMGGIVTAKVNLKDGYIAKDNLDTFNTKIEAEIDFKGLASKAYNKYNKDYAGKLEDYVVANKIDSTAKEDAIKLDVLSKVLIPDTSLIPEEKINEIKDKINELKTEYKDEIQKVKELLNELTYVPGFESATLTITPANGATITKTITEAEVLELKNKTTDELKTLAKEYIKTTDITIDSIIGGEVAVKVNLKPGYSAKDGADTFKAFVKAEIDFKGIANKVYDKYDADYASKLSEYVVTKKLDTSAKEDAIKLEATTKVLIPDTSLIPEEVVNKIKDKINELKTEYKDEIQKVKELLNEITYVPGFESVTLTITPANGVTITKTITEAEVLALKDKTTDELKTLAKEYIATTDITIDSIIGGEVAVKVNLKPGYSAKDGADTFKALVKAEIDFEGIVNTVYDKYETSYADKLKNYVSTKKINNTTLEITAKVLTTDMSLIPEEKINELKTEYKDEIQKVKELLNKITYIPGMESVTGTLTTSDGKVLTVNITEAEALELKNKTVDELKALVKQYITANNLTIDSIIGGEVTGKINLKPGYSAKNGVDTFKVIFKAEYNLEKVAEMAYNKFNTDYAIFLTSFAVVDKVKVHNIEENISDTQYNVLVKTTDEAMLTQLAKQMKAQLGSDLFNKVSSIPGVDTITVKLNTSDNRILSKDVTIDSIKNVYNMSIDDAKVLLKELAKKHNVDVNSILGGSVELTVNLKPGYSATNGIDTFKFNFVASEYNVIFDVDGVKTVETVKVGEKVSKPTDPTKEGYTFDKWLLNGNEYNFSTPVNVPITLKASWKVNTYEVKFELNNTGYGTVDKSSITVAYGSEIKVNGNQIEITDSETANTTKITATAEANTAEYKYSFAGWENVPEKVTGPLTIKANFNQEESKYTVTIVADTALGTVDVKEIKDVKYGTEIKVVGNTITIDGQTVTATPNTSDAQYTYSFEQWVTPDSVKDDVEIVAEFKKELNKYTISFATNSDELGSVSKTGIYDVPYGTAITVDGNKIKIGETTVEATPAANTADYKYSFKEWTNVPATNKVTESTVIYANFNQTEITKYTATFVSSDSTAGKVEGTLSIANIEEGTAIAIDGNKLTINGEIVTATANTSDAQYTYSFEGWSVANGTTITGDIEIKANFKKELNNYTVTLKANNDTYGKLSTTSVTVPYGSIVSVSGNTITIGGKTITATPTAKTETNYYSLENLSSTTAIIEDTEITVNFKKWTIVDVEGNVRSAVNANYESNRLKNMIFISSSQYKHSMDFSGPTNKTITLKYAGNKDEQSFVVYTLSSAAVESFDIIDLMENLSNNDKYESIIWDYNGWKNGGTELFDLMKLEYNDMNPTGFQTKTDSATIFARFMAQVSHGKGGSGSEFANITIDNLVSRTSSTPIKMKIKLIDGYITSEGETEVTYNVVFAK